MKRTMSGFILALLALLGAAPQASAQSADVQTPITRNSIARIRIDAISLTRSPNTVAIRIVYQDSSNNDILNTGLITDFSIPSTTGAGAPCTTTIDGYFTAVNAARSGETGTAPRRAQFRALGYLSDSFCYPIAITLVP